jgi:tricorn protease
VLLTIKPKGGGPSRDVIVEPITAQAEDGLRYDEWEYTRRVAVETSSQNRIGYVHLRAMGAGNMAEWMREFYPVFNRPGLVIDVRHNNGGNIDSWILGRLLRKAWFYWQPRVGHPTWNMQFAFRGHMVVVVDENTASDGEAFAEGFRRLGLGKVMGTRTWGGEIWLSSSNTLVDRGIATAALCPGWVSTDMGGPAAPLSPQESVAGLISVIERLEAANSGKFWSYSGEELTW